MSGRRHESLEVRRFGGFYALMRIRSLLTLSLFVFAGSAWPAPPPNDNFADAIDLGSEAFVLVTGSNVDATREEGERLPHAWSDDRTVWWRWTAPETGVFVVDTLESELRATTLGVYTGSKVDGLSLKESNNDVSGLEFRSRVILEAGQGTTYHIVITGEGGPGGGVALRISRPDPPPNDNRADAEDLGAEAQVAVSGSVLRGTLETGESDLTDTVGWNSSIWYRWTAPATGPVEVTTEGTPFSAGLAVYADSGPGGLVRGMWERSGRPAVVRVSAEAGRTYYVHVLADAARLDPVKLTLRPGGPAPANDRIADAADLGTGPVSGVEATNAGATAEIGEPFPMNDWSRLTDYSVWWRWKAAESGPVEIRAEGANPPVLAVYTGTGLDSLNVVVSDTLDGDPDGRGAVRMTAAGGQEYFIQASHRVGGNSPVPFTLSVEAGEAAASNDGFAAAAALSGALPLSASGSNLDATVEAGERTFGGGASVWWRWTAEATGPVQIDTTGSGIDTTLAVYTGAALDDLTLLAANRDIRRDRPGQGGGQEEVAQSLVRIHAVAGRVYWIQVLGNGSPSPATGALTLNLQAVDAPAGDLMAGAVALPGALPVAVEGDGRLATIEEGEPRPSNMSELLVDIFPRSSLWWKWTAPAAGWVGVEVSGRLRPGETGAVPPPYVAVYSGAPPAGLQEAGIDRFPAQAGATYYIQVLPGDEDSADGTAFALTLSALPDPPPNDLAASATDLGGGEEAVATGTTVNATAGPGEPDPDVTNSHIPLKNTVWFRWTAPLTGWVDLTFLTDEGPRPAGLNRRTNLAVYAGAPRTESILGEQRFQAVAGATYYIQAYLRGAELPPGEFSFRLAYGQGQLTGYAAWVSAVPGWGADHHAPHLDPDGDGIPNGLEYALGLDPARRNEPFWSQEAVTLGGEAYAALHLALPAADAPGLPRLYVEESSDLTSWRTVAVQFDHGGWPPGVETWVDGDIRHVRVTASQPVRAAGRLFLRPGTLIRY